jgi:hypothetical protein
MKPLLVVISGLLALIPASLGAGTDATEPRLELRTARRVGFSPVEALFVAKLVGGDELEEYYCPGVVWEWGDGSRSYSESDCPPFRPHDALQRVFTARHLYRIAGDHDVRVILLKSDRAIASASVRVLVRPRFGDR